MKNRFPAGPPPRANLPKILQPLRMVAPPRRTATVCWTGSECPQPRIHVDNVVTQQKHDTTPRTNEKQTQVRILHVQARQGPGGALNGDLQQLRRRVPPILHLPSAGARRGCPWGGFAEAWVSMGWVHRGLVQGMPGFEEVRREFAEAWVREFLGPVGFTVGSPSRGSRWPWARALSPWVRRGVGQESAGSAAYTVGSPRRGSGAPWVRRHSWDITLGSVQQARGLRCAGVRQPPEASRDANSPPTPLGMSFC